MAETYLPEEKAGSALPARQQESCTKCLGAKVSAVMMTSMVVYLRCDGCGNVWTVPQRRKHARGDDPRKL